MTTTVDKPLRVLVTDDTALYRRMLSDLFSKIPGVEVAGTSFDGEDCLVMLEKLRPDLVTLDINMPRRDGLSTLEEIRKRKLPTKVVMVSSSTAESAEQSMQALRNGAVDVVLKPSGHDFDENRKNLESQLLNQVDTIRSLLRRSPNAESKLPRESPRDGNSVDSHAARLAAPRPGTYECLCIGVSTGGPAALATILPRMPKEIPVPIFIVQHMPPVFTKSLAEHLNASCALNVVEASNGQVAAAGHVYIAPGGKQMSVRKKGDSFEIMVSDEPPVGGCKPSVDYLLDSVALCCRGNAIALILTGMGNDGLSGCRKLSLQGSYVMAQSAETCVVYGMPRQIVENQLASEILALDRIPNRIAELLKVPSCLH